MRLTKTATIREISAGLILNSDSYSIGLSTMRRLSGEDIVKRIIAKTRTWSFLVEDDAPYVMPYYPDNWTADQMNALNSFMILWDGFVTSEMNLSVSRALDALYADYDPISNYDKTSEIKRGTVDADYKTTETPSGTKTMTGTDTGTETDTLSKEGKISHATSYSKTDTHQVTTDENATLRNESQDGGSGSGTLTDTYGADGADYTETDTKSFTNRTHTDTESYDDYKTETEKNYTTFNKTIKNSGTEALTGYEHIYEQTSGNIGTVTAQQMITESIQLAISRMTDQIIDQFIRDYLFI